MPTTLSPNPYATAYLPVADAVCRKVPLILVSLPHSPAGKPEQDAAKKKAMRTTARRQREQQTRRRQRRRRQRRRGTRSSRWRRSGGSCKRMMVRKSLEGLAGQQGSLTMRCPWVHG